MMSCIQDHVNTSPDNSAHDKVHNLAVDVFDEEAEEESEHVKKIPG